MFKDEGQSSRATLENLEATPGMLHWMKGGVPLLQAGMARHEIIILGSVMDILMLPLSDPALLYEAPSLPSTFC